MKTFYIDGINKQCSAIGMGTMIFGLDTKERDFKLLDAFIENGGTYIDTAEVYGVPEEHGYSETVIGEWLNNNKDIREKIILCSKGLITGYCAPLHGEGGAKITPEYIKSAITGSLERLQTDYLDIWMFHRDDTSKSVNELMDALHDEVTQGRIKAFGASNWSIERIQEANQYAESKGQAKMIASSPQFSLAIAKEPFWPETESMDLEKRKWFIDNKFPLMAWSSLGRGFFTRADRNDLSDADLVRTYYNDDNFERKERAELLAKAKGLTMFEVALAYIINQPFPVIALNGAESPEQIVSSSLASDIVLSEEECDWLDLTSNSIPKSVI
ncbi:aldo/keto reductase [Marinomonas flavescens]|uniref:aldo/keto reductase n=1 Tax=Marinomonas flavescens TaxID=2529379 RepID=UPI001055E5D6|nr:aldo/keto reductase [Marinomonas flavescens]